MQLRICLLRYGLGWNGTVRYGLGLEAAGGGLLGGDDSLPSCGQGHASQVAPSMQPHPPLSSCVPAPSPFSSPPFPEPARASTAIWTGGAVLYLSLSRESSSRRRPALLLASPPSLLALAAQRMSRPWKGMVPRTAHISVLSCLGRCCRISGALVTGQRAEGRWEAGRAGATVPTT